MEEVLDALVAEVKAINELDFEDGGIADFLELVDVKLDDPGVVSVDEYPYAFVAPVMDEPRSETAGRAGWDVRLLYVNIVFVVNAPDYFDPDVSEVSGTRELVRASGQLRKWLRRLHKRQGLATGVRNIVVQSTNYVPDIRGDAFVKTAVTTLVVERQYQHQE